MTALLFDEAYTIENLASWPPSRQTVFTALISVVWREETSNGPGQTVANCKLQLRRLAGPQRAYRVTVDSNVGKIATSSPKNKERDAYDGGQPFPRRGQPFQQGNHHSDARCASTLRSDNKA